MTKNHAKSINTTKVVAFLGLGMASLIWGSTAAIADDYYRWQNNEGVVHYTDKPPLGSPFETLNGKSKAPKLSKEEQKAADMQALKNAELCKKERERLDILKNNEQIQLKKVDGTTHYLTAKEITAQIAQSLKAIDSYCEY